MTKRFFISNMNCKHCVAKITTALNDITDVKIVKNDLKNKFFDITLLNNIDENTIKNIITEKGYTVNRIEEI